MSDDHLLLGPWSPPFSFHDTSETTISSWEVNLAKAEAGEAVVGRTEDTNENNLNNIKYLLNTHYGWALG